MTAFRAIALYLRSFLVLTLFIASLSRFAFQTLVITVFSALNFMVTPALDVTQVVQILPFNDLQIGGNLEVSSVKQEQL